MESFSCPDTNGAGPIIPASDGSFIPYISLYDNVSFVANASSLALTQSAYGDGLGEAESGRTHLTYGLLSANKIDTSGSIILDNAGPVAGQDVSAKQPYLPYQSLPITTSAEAMGDDDFRRDANVESLSDRPLTLEEELQTSRKSKGVSYAKSYLHILLRPCGELQLFRRYKTLWLSSKTRHCGKTI